MAKLKFYMYEVNKTTIGFKKWYLIYLFLLRVVRRLFWLICALLLGLITIPFIGLTVTILVIWWVITNKDYMSVIVNKYERFFNNAINAL